MRYKKSMIKNRILRTLLLVVIGLAIAGLIAYVQIKNETSVSPTSVMVQNFGGNLDLITEDGNPFTEDDFNEGQYRLIYFGFTYCPAICPTELQRMSTVLNNLGDKASKIDPYFITVDPERDTVDVMQKYTEMFHPRLLGLTGNQKQIDQAKKSYKIYAAKVQDETMSDYTMDHSSYIYFISPDNDLLRIFKVDDSIGDMTKIIKQNIQ